MANPDSRPLVLHIVHRFDFGGLENGLVNLVNHMPEDRFRHHIMALTEVSSIAERITAGNAEASALGKRHCYPLQLVRALEQVRSHLVVIGNAAHFLHPVAGQGFNLSLRDCQALVDCLVESRQHSQQNTQQRHSPGDLKVLNKYLARQQQDQQLTIGLTDQLVKLEG